MLLITEVTVDVDLVRSYDNFLIGRHWQWSQLREVQLLNLHTVNCVK